MTGPFVLFGVLAVALLVGVADALPPQKIVGGSAATLGEFPYQVSLRLRGSHLCGGAIVGPKHIVTAAHCVVGPVTRPYTNFRIATGSVSSWSGTTHAVSKVTSHPGYENKNQDSRHDIAVIELSTPITFNKNQDKIDLPKTPTPGGVTATATGWGAKSARSPGVSWELMKVGVKTMEPNTCGRYFRGGNVRNDHICTFSGHGLGTCQGDSGGPLAYNGTLIGVVSYGIPCAVGYPDVYAGVYHYVDWIKKTMGTK